MDASWWVLGGFVALVVVGALFYFRSLRRWRGIKPTSAEAKQGEARLWSTRSMDQR